MHANIKYYSVVYGCKSSVSTGHILVLWGINFNRWSFHDSLR